MYVTPELPINTHITLDIFHALQEMMKTTQILPTDTFNALAEYLCVCGKERAQGKTKIDRRMYVPYIYLAHMQWRHSVFIRGPFQEPVC